MRQRGFLGYWVLGAVVVLAAIAVAVAASGGSDKTPAAKARQRKAAVKKHLAQVRRAPLTGLPDKKGVSFKRPAVTVKINNTDAAKQYGVDQADVVYEEVVEGQYTRLAAIFNSHAPDRVGPVRSVRRTDQSLVWPIGGIFAYSGGAQYAIDSINTAPVKQLDETRAGAMMFRDGLETANSRRSAVQPVGARRPDVQGRTPSRSRRRRCSPTASRRRRSAARRSSRSSSGSQAGSTNGPGTGTRAPAPGCARSSADPTSTPTTCGSRRRTSS